MGAVSTDAELIDAILAGRLEAYDELMRRYERLVFKVAYGYGGSRDNAFDITQTVFLQAYRHLGSFRRESSFKTWLLRITYNESSNWNRRHRRHQGHTAIELETEILSPGSQEADTLHSERLTLLQAGLGALNARYRLALELRYFQELPIREIADVLGCSEGVAKNILFRGVRRLRSELQEVS